MLCARCVCGIVLCLLWLFVVFSFCLVLFDVVGCWLLGFFLACCCFLLFSCLMFPSLRGFVFLVPKCVLALFMCSFISKVFGWCVCVFLFIAFFCHGYCVVGVCVPPCVCWSLCSVLCFALLCLCVLVSRAFEFACLLFCLCVCFVWCLLLVPFPPCFRCLFYRCIRFVALLYHVFVVCSCLFSVYCSCFCYCLFMIVELTIGCLVFAGMVSVHVCVCVYMLFVITFLVSLVVRFVAAGLRCVVLCCFWLCVCLFRGSFFVSCLFLGFFVVFLFVGLFCFT